MMPRSRDNSVSELPASVLERRVQALTRTIPKAVEGDVEAVHQLRVAGRRLRVALPLLAKRPHGKRVRRARNGLSEIVRIAGGTRDLDVGLGLLDSLLDSPPSAEGRQLRGRLRAVRARGRAKLRGALSVDDLASLRRELRSLVGRADVFERAVERTRAALYAQGLRARAEVLAAGSRFEPRELHALRRRLRRFRYVVETAEALGVATAEGVDILKEQQSLLGNVQDADVLAGYLCRVAARCESRGERDLALEARRLEDLGRERSRYHHRIWLDGKPLDRVDHVMALLGIRHLQPASADLPGLACGVAG
jgi:CHAD domain-containing protein